MHTPLIALALFLGLLAHTRAEAQWRPKQEVAAGASSTDSLKIAFNNTKTCARTADSTIHFTWAETVAPIAMPIVLNYGQKTPLVPWATTSLPTGGDAINKPTLARIPGSEQLMISWWEENLDDINIYMVESTDGGATWSATAQLVHAPDVPVESLALDVHWGGQTGSTPMAIVCWVEDPDPDNCTGDVYCKTWAWGTDPTTVSPVGVDVDEETCSQDVTVDARLDDVIVGYDDKFNVRLASSADAGGTFTARDSIEPGNDANVWMRPNDGRVFITYQVPTGVENTCAGMTGILHDIYARVATDITVELASTTEHLIGQGYFPNIVSTNAPYDVAITWERTVCHHDLDQFKTVGFVRSSNDLVTSIDMSLPPTGRTHASGCMSNGVYDVVWLEPAAMTGTVDKIYQRSLVLP